MTEIIVTFGTLIGVAVYDTWRENQHARRWAKHLRR